MTNHHLVPHWFSFDWGWLKVPPSLYSHTVSSSFQPESGKKWEAVTRLLQRRERLWEESLRRRGRKGSPARPSWRHLPHISGWHVSHTYSCLSHILITQPCLKISVEKVHKSRRQNITTKVHQSIKSLKMHHLKAKCPKIWNQECVNQRFWAFLQDFSTLLDRYL